MNVEEVSALRESLEQVKEDKGLLQDEVRELKHEIDRLKIRLRELWGASCEQVVEHDKEISSKDEEIASLKERLGRLLPSILEVSDTVVTRPVPPLPLPSVSTDHEVVCIASTRRGKALPVDPFTGENPEIRLDEWLPSTDGLLMERVVLGRTSNAACRTSAWQSPARMEPT